MPIEVLFFAGAYAKRPASPCAMIPQIRHSDQSSFS
jgi:hypothetical protein